MSRIVTSLVSGLPPFFIRRYVAFILGFPAMPPVPFVASCLQVGCCLPVGSKIPAKLHFLVLQAPPFRLCQSLCISPPIVRRPFEFPLSAVVFFHRISYPLVFTSPLFSLSIPRHTLWPYVFRLFVFLSLSR